PTGTISVVADASSGIEPLFSLGYQKNTVEGKVLQVMNPVFIEELKKRNIYSEQLLDKVIKNGGKIAEIREIPEEVKEIFRTALEISPEWHVRIQAAFQKYTDNAVSKTINFPKEATVDEVRKAYLLAYSLGTKGVTIYRSGSREKEVIQQVKSKKLIVPVKKPTPEAARGVRLRKPCDAGRVYTSVFFEEGNGPVEVFVNLGKSGGYMAGSAEVTGRLASLSLKYGATLEEVAEELVGISCGQRIGFGNGTVLSMFDAVGKSLLEISRGEQLDLFQEEKQKLVVPKVNGKQQNLINETRIKQTDLESKFSACPDCGSPLYAEEGCYKCSNNFCVGALDEAQAVLGGLGLEEIQGDLYQIMALKFNKKRILDLESKIKILEGELEPVDKFIIFQKTEAVYLNWVRTIIRRAERKVMVWKNNKDILVYLNRLSDFIYLKARKAEEK
ncbi:MAG: Ribonucleoside-diphosphate reductase, partial [Microgenomates group bacterium GW2011_GWA2_40_6]